MYIYIYIKYIYLYINLLIHIFVYSFIDSVTGAGGVARQCCGARLRGVGVMSQIESLA